MNRTEALRTLGLSDDATAEDIKAAYREMAQILHPDRFANNKKLQDRATEQFKNLQEAYDYLKSGRAAQRGGRAAGSGPADFSREGFGAEGFSGTAEQQARLAGIKAARVQLVKQKDVALDERRKGWLMLVAGIVVALLTWRFTRGAPRIVSGLGGALAVWGFTQVLSSQRTVATIDEHLRLLQEEQKRIEEDMDE